MLKTRLLRFFLWLFGVRFGLLDPQKLYILLVSNQTDPNELDVLRQSFVDAGIRALIIAGKEDLRMFEV